MANTEPGLSLPTQQQRIAYESDEAGTLLTTVEWYRFFQGLFNRSNTGPVSSVAVGQDAVGTTQATALQLTDHWVEVITTPVNSGVMLDGFGEGLESRVFNRGVNDLNVYPPVGCQIDNLGANIPFTLLPNKMQIFTQVSATQFYSLQL